MKSDGRVLLVDDEPDFLESIVPFFRHRDIAFDTAGNCTEAMALLKQYDFDVVVMDVRMPGIDGIECMARMKESWPELEVIILTGHIALQSGLTGMKQGAFDYCLKPVDPVELLEKVLLAKEKFRIKGL